MFLIAGLGNPGSSYAKNRHNIGFMLAERIRELGMFAPWKNRFHGQTSEGTLADVADKIILLKPETFMNESGRAVQAAMQFYKITPDRLFVFHDELDLICGKVRVKRGGGAAGHNGLRSIDQAIGPDYWRVRLGIGHPGDKNQVHNYVLGNFAATDQDWLETLLNLVPKHLPLLLKGQDALFMTRVTQAPKTAQEG